jgi:hypothetical protein
MLVGYVLPRGLSLAARKIIKPDEWALSRAFGVIQYAGEIVRA